MRFGAHRRVRPATTKDTSTLQAKGNAVPGMRGSADTELNASEVANDALSGAAGTHQTGTTSPADSPRSLGFAKRSISSFLRRIVPSLSGSARSRFWAAKPLAAAADLSKRRALLLARLRSVVLTALWFMPGAFFIAIGFSVAFAPQMLMSAVAGFCVFFGFASFGLACKFIQLKNRVERVAQSFETRIMVQAIPHGKLADPEERAQEAGTPQSKKILFH